LTWLNYFIDKYDYKLYVHNFLLWVSKYTLDELEYKDIGYITSFDVKITQKERDKWKVCK
jgi:hypothetical protein